MKKKNSFKIIMLFILGIIAIFVIKLLWDLGFETAVRYEEPQKQKKTEIYITDSEEEILLEQVKEKLAQAEWGKDPFVLKEEKLSPLQDLSSFKISGIILAPEGAYAVVNDEIVKIGDYIGDFKVIEIFANEIILEKDGERTGLHLWEAEGAK